MDGDEDARAPIDSRGIEVAYEVAARRLERRIRAGEWKYQMPIPSEPALAEMYEVSRTTIRSAIDILIERRLVRRVRGKGTYVIWQGD